MKLSLYLKQLLAIALVLFAFGAQAQQDPFSPARGANTSNVVVTGTAATLTLPTAITGVARQVVLLPIGSQNVFYLCDGTAAASPTTATVSNAQPIQANYPILITLPSSITQCSVIAAGTGSTLYATVGIGR